MSGQLKSQHVAETPEENRFQGPREKKGGTQCKHTKLEKNLAVLLTRET